MIYQRQLILIALATMSVLGRAPIFAGDSSLSGWTRVNDDDPSVSYSANVGTHSNGDYYNKDMHSAQAVGDWCKFSFVGTAVKWIGGKNLDHGKADVYVDGKLDATVDSTAPTWLTQQELYTKTGLNNGPHVLMIQNKTADYQDFDAFEYFAPPPAPPAPKNLGNMTLPAQVPYLNPAHRYPLGNGVAMAVGGPTGEWSQLSGPGYTTPNYVNSESLALQIDGVERPLNVEMKRARETGVYYGVVAWGDLQVWLIDYAPRGRPSITRLVMIDNISTTASHDVRLRAMIRPRSDAGMTKWLVKDAEQNRCGMAIQADTTVEVPYGGKGATDRSVVVSFADPSGTAYVSGDIYTLETKLNQLAPHGSCSISLGHYFRSDKTSDADCVAAIRSMKSVADLEKTVTDWQAWFRQVGPGYQLSKITDVRGRDLMEGALAILKTNQSLDGGIIAHSTFYKEGYIRDAALALRGLTAAGHFDESKQWLLWLDHMRTLFGHLPDACSCDVLLTNHSYNFDMGNAGVEETALFLITARDYYAGTKDIETLKKLDASLRYCMDIQLKDAVANSYKLEFNGDETEICGAVDVSRAGTAMNDNAQKGNWSFSSVGMCAAALDFYMQYLKIRGEDPAKYKNALTGTTMDLPAELGNLLKAMDADFWRTDVPEIPDGFHDSFRRKGDNAWPLKRIVNFTLMPLYYEAPYASDEKARDAAAIAHYFDEKTGFLQLVPGIDNGFDGHDLGYLLWSLAEVGNPKKEAVYKALVNGPTPDCWGSFDEAYDSAGDRNGHDLRSLETGCNVSAIAKYWNLGP
jgi:hypothetical protein